MPLVSHFHGITVRIHYSDHAPPHLHAYHGGREVLIEIATATVLRGGLPPKQAQYLLPWIVQRRAALIQAWNLASQNQPPGSVPYP